MPVLLGILNACGGSSFNGLENSVNSACSITNTSPSATSFKVSGIAGTITHFTAGLSDVTCTVAYAVNGIPVTSTGASLDYDSANFVAGKNTVTAISGLSTTSWTVYKNSPPVCSSYVPATTGSNVGVGASLAFSANATDADSDPLTFSFEVNGAQALSSVLSTSSTASSGQATFNPDSTFLGANTISMLVGDGTDVTTCSWSVEVNGSCSIASVSPSNTNPVRVASASGTTTPFTVNGSGGCAVFTWTLNGITISGAHSGTYNLPSSTLIAGNNTLVASASNGSSTPVTTTWTVIKNTPPVCSSQTPAATGNAVGANTPITLIGDATDSSGNALTFAWKDNGNAVDPNFFNITSGPNSTQAVFTPDNTFVGSNSISAIISDGLDTSSCNWTVQVSPACQLVSSAPSTTTYKMAYAPTTSQAFAATSNDPSCVPVWSLNGTVIPGATSALVSVLSSQLNNGPATNTLQVTYSNGATSAQRAWTITKNQPPTCASQNPAASGQSVGVGSSLLLAGTAGNADSDPLSFSWLLNNASISTLILNPANSGNVGQANFTPTTAQIGNALVTMNVSDGYDSASCNWTVGVNSACAIGSVSPLNTGSIRVANAGTTSTSFQANANGCNSYVWTLNGTAISGATAANINLLSSQLLAGANSLQVSATNGTSSDSKTWTVIKNTPPTCSGQTPTATGSTVGIGGSPLVLTANGSDSNGNPLTFAWLDNGTAVSSNYFTISGAGSSSQASFAPDSTLIGTNNISAVISDGYDTTSCAWNVQVLTGCQISTSSPSTSTYKVPQLGTTATQFVATANDASCSVTWKLNGTTIPGATSSVLSLTSAQLYDAPNTNSVQAIYSNGYAPATRTWTVTKNQPSTCATQNPAATGNSLGAGATLGFNLTASNPDSDTLSYIWQLNNVSVSTAVLNPISSGTTSQATFYPTVGYVGPNIVTALINDGYDTTSCNWNVNVNGNCAISSTTPLNTTSTRVSSVGTTATNFQAVTSPGCSNYTWTLNGTPISGANGSTYSVLSSLLSTGNNTLTATVTNGTSSDSKSWTVVKNSPPTCGSQTPVATGNSVSVGNTLTFTANGADPNSLPLTYSWANNGTAVNNSFFTVTNPGSSSQAVFAPNASFVGNNTLVATISDGYDQASCSWNVAVSPSCQIASASPSTATLKVPFLATSTQSFVATANDPSCAVTWSLNGTTLSGATNSVLSLASSQLSAGPSTNTLVATYSNGASSAQRVWTITKNQPPTCASQTPASTGSSLGTGSSLAFNATAGNPDSDSMTYVWTINNGSVSNTVLNPSNSGNTASATFYPTGAFVGPNLVTATLFDGYDSASCNWNVTVNGNCAIGTTTPTAGTSVRVANAASTTTSFTAPTSPACSNYIWSLNGSAISGATESTAQIQSSLLSTGNNTLQVSVTNGSSSDSKTWTVVKNTPPVCSSQTPSATNNSIGVSAPLTLVANGTDANPLTFTWQNNGSAVNGDFVITNSASSSQAVFTPDATLVGSNSISAILNDGYDSTTCNWAVQVYPQCTIASAFPSSSTLRVPFAAGTSNSFVASANDPSCAVTWSLNGTTVAGATSSALTLTSSQLNAGPAVNTVVATYANGSSSVSRTWNVTKNQPPTCATQTPTSSGNSLGVGSTLTFNETAGNPDSDTLTYAWALNNASVSTALLNPNSSGNTSSAIFSPTSLYVGPNIVTSTINDGYDTASCNWNVTVNGSCAITSTTPSTATPLRVANAGSTSTTFTAATSASCANYTWTLNGSVISGATGSSYSVLSSALATGNNTLQVSVTNGTSPATQSWTIVKNTPPVCSSQTPNASGTVVGVNTTQNFVAGATDANGDALSFTWTDNGSPVNSSYFTITNSSGSSQAAFTPNASFVGANTLSATVSDGYDTTACNWSLNVQQACSVTSASPSTSTSKIPFAPTTSNSFVTVVNDSSCTPTWTLNGTAVSGATNPVLALTSSQFLAGPSTNTLVATYANSTSSTTRTWTVTKNQPPTCATQSPTPSNNSLGSGSSIAFTGTAGNPDSDSLTYGWSINNASVSNAVLNPTSSGNSSSATFYSSNSYLGANVISMNVSDGYDSASCNWSVTVNPSCSFTASTPAASTSTRVAASAGTSTTFSTTASTGCSQFSWSLNGATISGATGSNYSVPSSALSVGNNTLSVTVTNGTSPATQSWTVVKNSPPTCSSQTPAATGNTIGAGQNITLNANGSDGNSDPLTFAWQNNGTAINPAYFVVTNGSGTSQAVFSPDATLVGSNAVTATISDGYDTTSCTWAVTVKPACSIASSSPSTTTYKVPFLSTSSQTYVATANDGSCTPTWTLNGTTLSGQTAASVTLTSSQLNAGPSTNALVATYTNGSTTTSRTWTITKNQLSTCSTQTPAVTGNSIGVGGNETFSATAGNPDSDTLSYNWYWNGSSLSTAILNPTSAGNTSSAVFTPTSSQVGASNTASVQISDGYDNVSCSWAVAVNNSCAISGTLPSTTTYKTAFAPSTSNLFFANYDTSCTPTWTLNGSTINTSSAYVSILSSALTNGPTANNVTLSVTNGTSTTTRSWVVTKNQVPVCSSIVPATTTPTPMAYNVTKPFTANLSDPDGDTLSGFAWTFNGASASSIFTNVTSNATSSSTTFAPTFSQVGTGQVIGFNFTDGYDAESCQWTMNILNPNTVSMTSCNPTTNPVVVYSAGANSTQTLQMIASNASSYQWFKGGSSITGSTNSSLVLATGSYPTGTYSFQGTAYDSLNNAASCPYTVKFNAPPVIGSATPLTTQTWKMNIGSTLGFNVAATDANNDSLTYTWTLDGAANSALTSGSASATLNPNYNYTLVGAHTVSVNVSDGYESVSQSWNVQINLFSQVCDNLWNGTVATTGGQVCTLVGVPGIGNGLVPSADQTKIRLHPDYVIDDGSGNWFVVDTISNAVQFFNRSGASITRFGLTMAAGTMTTIIGDGAAGVSADNLYNNNYKLNTPQGVAFDSATGNLFIADYNNHRVAMMSNTGFVTTVLGVTGGGTNATAANTDGQVGTNSVCNNPTDVHIVNYGGARWLYVSCYGTNAIKRLDILPTSGTYLNAYMVVGATTTGVTAAGTTDGATGLTGTATTNGPWALADDGQGNIYWTEYSSYRVKVAATGGSTLTFFGGLSNNTGTTTITAADTATTGTLTAGTASISPAAVSSTIASLKIVGPSSVVPNDCVAYRVQSWNASSTVANVSGATAVVMTGTGTGSFYTDSGCTVNTGFTIANNASETTVYFKSASATTTTFTATAGTYTGTLPVTVVATSTATKLAVIAPANYDYTTCTKLTVQAQNASSVPSTLTTAKTIRMSNNAVGNFFTTANCSGTPTYLFTMASGTTELPVYFATTMIAPANQTATLFGNQSTNSTLPSNNTAIPIGSTFLRYPRGLAVATSGSTVTGFYVSQYDQERITYYNNTSSTTTIGGDAIPGYYAGVVAGTGSAGFNTDQIGENARIYTGYGIALSANANALLVADYDNYRVRALDLTTGSGILTTYLGVGYGRAGNLGDSPIAATSMYLNTPGEAVIDNTNNLLYVSDSASGRIRRVNLLTGYVDTIIGEGVGGGTTENVTPTNVYMNSPRGLVLMSNSTQNFLVYADQASNTAVNSDCQIRALNLTPSLGNPTPTATSLFNVSINPYSVATVAGDYGLGCEPWNTAPINTSGGPALQNHIYNPEGIASDGTNLFIADYNDHCILKLAPGGTTTPVIGTCGTAGTTDGSTSVALIRYPTGIVMDPLNPGNFFFADAVDLNPSRVRYVNYLTTTVQIGSVTVPAATSPNGIVTTIWTVAPSGNSAGQIFGLAAFGTQLCMAGGSPTSGGTGTHNVTCYNRSNSLGPVTLRIGPNETSAPPIRGGAPLNNTIEEGVTGANALLNAPYGLTFDSAGNLYIVERANHLIRMVSRWF